MTLPTSQVADAVTIRRATRDDHEGIGDVWLASWRATFDFPPSHPDEGVRRWLRERLVPDHETWVAIDAASDTASDTAGVVIGLMALSNDMIEQLYVAPPWIGRGLGRRFIQLARERRPDGLDLYCFQVNTRARSFYEHHGFREVARGDGSGNQEQQPDIRYAWRPTQ